MVLTMTFLQSACSDTTSCMCLCPWDRLMRECLHSTHSERRAGYSCCRQGSNHTLQPDTPLYVCVCAKPWHVSPPTQHHHRVTLATEFPLTHLQIWASLFYLYFLTGVFVVSFIPSLNVMCLYIYIYTILPKVSGRPLLMNRFDYFSNFYEYKS